MRMLPHATLALGLAIALSTPAPAHAAPGAKPALGWIADDYSKALAEARARKLPLFIESWAPW